MRQVSFHNSANTLAARHPADFDGYPTAGAKALASVLLIPWHPCHSGPALHRSVPFLRCEHSISVNARHFLVVLQNETRVTRFRWRSVCLSGRNFRQLIPWSARFRGVPVFSAVRRRKISILQQFLVSSEFLAQQTPRMNRAQRQPDQRRPKMGALEKTQPATTILKLQVRFRAVRRNRQIGGADNSP